MITWLLFLGLALPRLAAQCSDAGACAVGHLGPSNRIALREVEAGSGAPDRLRFHTLRLEGQFSLWEGAQVLVILPFVKIEGPQGTNQGLGDLVGLLDQRLLQGDGWSLALQAGGRFGTGEADGAPDLPQKYQTGLGGLDPLLGLRGTFGAWSAGVAHQRAAGRSGNPITRLRRGDDGLLWVERSMAFGASRLELRLLGIQRLGRSSVRVPGSSPEAFEEVPESDRLQVNLEALLSVPLVRAWALQLGAALPFLSRPANDDGLKRSWTASVGVACSF